MNAARSSKNPLLIIECSYCRSKIGFAHESPGVAICGSPECQAAYIKELVECEREVREESQRNPKVKKSRKKGAAKQTDWIAPEGHFEKDEIVGMMVAKIFRNVMRDGTIVWKCTLRKKLPDKCAKEFGDSIREVDLNDAMRALYRAQRFIKKRRRQLGVCRGVFSWLP